MVESNSANYTNAPIRSDVDTPTAIADAQKNDEVENLTGFRKSKFRNS